MIGLFDALENLLDAKRFARNLFSPHMPSLNPAQWKKDYEKLFPLKEKLGQAFEETGILHLMATKPDTICGALVDSPVGMAAHVLEKYSSFVDMANRDLKNGGLNQKWTKDELLTIVMIFWNARDNFAGTCRMYKELVSAGTGVTK